MSSLGVYTNACTTINLNYATAVSSQNLVFQQFVPVETGAKSQVREAELQRNITKKTVAG